METKAKRTLVKSAPELWELADDEARMRAWAGALGGDDGGRAARIEVTAREPGSRLAWRGGEARIEITLAESGFGTAVRISARHPDTDPAAAGAALEGLLDELGSPERRPFVRA